MELFYRSGILSAASVDFTDLKCHKSWNKKARSFGRAWEIGNAVRKC
jgi:hypothetical protein